MDTKDPILQPVTYIPTKDLSRIATDAADLCKSTGARNLFLAYEFQAKLIGSPFAKRYRTDAEKWQSPVCPDDLHFNHGQYIHVNGDGIKYIISSLKSKEDSTRAFYSLVGMNEVAERQETLPSFLLLQAAREGKVLYLTTYFRALEVCEFLPRNIAEICLVCERILTEIHGVEIIRLVIHAFRAYARPGFDCLSKASIDQQGRGIIAVHVMNEDKGFIQRMLESKRQDSSIISTHGLDELNNAIREAQKAGLKTYSAAFAESVDSAYKCLLEIEEQRTRHSFASVPPDQYKAFKGLLGRALENL